jgi:hypothetical protein
MIDAILVPGFSITQVYVITTTHLIRDIDPACHGSCECDVNFTIGSGQRHNIVAT